VQVFPDHRSFAVKEIQATEDAQAVAEHWEKEAKALRMMNELNQEHIVHFVTAFRRRKENGGEEHYLMFEWADGGNLRSLWKDNPFPLLTASLVKDAIKQILGLARALEAAHNLNTTGASYRHGDLKPENILLFSGGGSIGTLKIGDWGEAKEHEQVTEMRPSKTTAKYGTRR
jgi:serine/threonine protein kinase